MTAVTQTEAFSQLEECILKEFIRESLDLIKIYE
jgi:hypothetical protein